jgi:glucosamine--fructose-6-phosphate aminotransferase (isomerizing)
MCGIFGFLSTDGRGPDLACLRRIAAETETRGRHAFGLAWIDAHGSMHTFKRPGAATACLADLDACHDAMAAIGHCRFATHGDPQDNRNNHPHPAGRGWLVHNGVVRNYADLVRHYALRPKTDCDSEVLGLLMMRRAGTLPERAAWAVARTEGPLAMLGLWDKPVRLLVVRRGNPLCFSETPGGFYFASLPAGLPGKVCSITDEHASVLRLEGGSIKHQGLATPT